MLPLFCPSCQLQALRSAALTFASTFVATLVVTYPVVYKFLMENQLVHSPRVGLSLSLLISLAAAFVRWMFKQLELSAARARRAIRADRDVDEVP